MSKATARNVAIILALGSLVYFVPQGGRVANTVFAVLSITFASVFAYFVGNLYREHRLALYSLGDRHRALLYGAGAAGVVTLAATPRLWQSGAGEIVWLAIMGGVAYALLLVFRFARSL